MDPNFLWSSLLNTILPQSALLTWKNFWKVNFFSTLTYILSNPSSFLLSESDKLISVELSKSVRKMLNEVVLRSLRTLWHKWPVLTQKDMDPLLNVPRLPPSMSYESWISSMSSIFLNFRYRIVTNLPLITVWKENFWKWE